MGNLIDSSFPRRRIGVNLTASDVGSLSRWRERARKRARVRVGKLEQVHEKQSRGALTPALSQRERE
jgi:hypothetical protein